MIHSNMNNYIQNKYSNSAGWFIALLWGHYPLLYYVSTLSSHIPVIRDFSNWIVPLFMIGLFGFSGKYFASKLKGKTVFLLLVLDIIFVVNYIFYPENNEVLNPYALPFLCFCTPSLLLGSSVEIETFEKKLYAVSAVCIIAQLFFNFVFLRYIYSSSTDNTNEDMMVAAYQILKHVMMVCWFALRKPQWHSVLLAIIGVFMIFSYGNRGSLLLLCLFMLLYILCFRFRTLSIAKRILIIIPIVLLIVYSEKLLVYFTPIAVMLGMSNRLLNRFEDGVLFDNNGRDELLSKIFPAINDGNIFGLGLAGDRQVLGVYSHNIIIELLASFGYLFGSIMLIALTVLIVKTIKANKSSSESAFFLLLLCCSLELMLSSTFLVESIIFWLIGYCIMITNKSKNYG